MKKAISIILTLALLISCFCVSAFAVAPEPRASLTLTRYLAVLESGNIDGEIKLSFDVLASSIANSLGVKTIKIYNSDGSYVKTIAGSTSNGLTATNHVLHTGTYDCSVTSGMSYYAEVTVYATVGSVSDSRTIVTDVVTAP